MRKFIKILRLNYRYIIKMSMRGTSAVYAFLGLVGTFVSMEGLFNTNTTILKRILISIGILAAVWGTVCVMITVYLCVKRRFEILDVGNGHHVYVQYGDVFSKDVVLTPDERRNIVIPVNRCFDTIVNSILVSPNTLHGKTMLKLYASKQYNEESLNEEIQRQLAERKIEYELLNQEGEKSGNLKRYPVGTVAELSVNKDLTYFFLGLTAFDKENHAHISNEEYVLALGRLIKYCNTRSQGYPVVMPLIGGGLPNTEKREDDILEYLVRLIKLNRLYINCDLHIVVRAENKNSIGIAGL